jgi:NAD(P)-dependent dehydrogenase (short-subunit alcohol dehydrogenase family)
LRDPRRRRPDAQRGFLGSARQELGSVDVLVNNVSAFAMGDNLEAWKASLDVDLLAPVLATQHVLPWMIDAGGGSIIHVSSISGVEAGLRRGQGCTDQSCEDPGRKRRTQRRACEYDHTRLHRVSG